MKQTFKFLTVFLLALLGASNLWATNETVYFSPSYCSKDWKAPWVNYRSTWNDWHNIAMSSTTETYHDQPVFKATLDNNAGGYNTIEFHKSENDWDKVVGVSSWNTSGKNNKICTGESSWADYSADATVHIYYAASPSANSVKIAVCRSYDDGQAKNFKEFDMTKTDKTYNGNPIWEGSYVTWYGGLGKFEFNVDGSYNALFTGWKSTDDFGASGKICTSTSNGGTWVTYEYDVTVTPQTCVNGTISPSGAQTFLGSTGKQFTANGSAGYCWESWQSSTGVNATNANPTKVTATQNGTLSATFKQRYILRGSLKQENDPAGGMPGWHETTNANYTIDGNVATVTANLTAAHQQYKFRIYDATTENTMRGQTGSSEMKNGDNWQLNGSNDVLFTSTVPGTYTFAIDFTNATSPSLTLTFPSFSRTITVPTQIQPQAAFDITLGSPTVSGFTPTKYMLCTQKDGGEWTESGQINANTYSFTPSGAGNYKFKVRAYANETDYLESAESNTVKVAGLTVEASDYNPSKGSLVSLTPTPSSNLTSSEYDLAYEFTAVPDGSTAVLSLNAGKIEFTGNVPGAYTVRVSLKDKADNTRTLATADVTINYVDEYWIYFKKTVAGWGDNVYLYFEVSWDESGTYGARADVAPIMMTQMGETDVYGVKVPQEYENMDYIAFCNTSVAKDAYLTGKAVYRGDYNKTYNMFVPSTISNESKSATYYSNGRWFKYDTDKGYKLIVESNETALTFPSEASLTPANINLNFAANQELAFTLESQGQSTTFYLPSTLEISNCADLRMTDVSNSNKFLTALAGQYQVSIDFNVNNPKVEPTINVTYPAVPAPSVTFKEQRYNGDNALSFISGDGSQASPYQLFMDEKMTLTISEMPEVKGLTAYYKFGESDASATRTLDIVPEDNKVHSIIMEAYYEKGTVKTASTTKTIYYKALPVPAIHLTSNLTNNEVNYDEWNTANPQIHYTADNYDGAFTITKNDESWKYETGATKDYAIEDPMSPQFINLHASFESGSREFATDLTITAYRNVLYKVKDGVGFTASKVYMWRNGTTPTFKNAEWPGEDFISNFGNWHIFTVKYPIYDRWIVNGGQNNNHQTNNTAVDGNSSNICLKIADSGTAGTGDNNGKTFYDVSSAECPGHILVDPVDNQSVTKNTSKLIAPNVYIMVGVLEQEITMVIEKNNDNVTVLQSGMSVLVTGMKTGTTNVTVKYYYHKDQIDEELAQISFMVTITQPQITIRANIATNLGWTSKDNIWLKYWDDNDKDYAYQHNVQMTWDTWNETTKRDEYYATFTFPDGVESIKFQVGYPNGESWGDEWRKSWLLTGVTSSSCYDVSFDGDEKSRKMEAVDCGDSEYQIVINMNSGDEYKSNKVTSADATLSFFAPGVSETGYKAGLVRLFNKDEQLAIIPASTFAASGVYMATINDTYNGLEDVELYTGDYYIRTDGADGHWDNYKTTADNKFVKFDKIETSTYDHYWVKNIKPASNGAKVNLQACVANDYNENLANKIEKSNYTDDNGSVTPDASGVNLRFGYDPATNNFERAIIKGSATDEFLNVIGDNVYKEQECTNLLNIQNANSKFEDKEQWIYEKTVYVQIDAFHSFSEAKLQSKDYSGNVMYQLGYTIDPITGKPTSTPKTFGLIAAGTTPGTYAIKLVYDFKTNRMVSGWTPSEDPIDGTIVLDADMLLVRNHQNSAAQIKFANNSSAIQQIHHIYGVMEIEKEKMVTNSAGASNYERHLYWISFPFDVKISSIFGVGTYGVEWKLQRYDGAERASKGWFKGDGTTTFWKNMTIDETLKANEGYILNLKPSAFDDDKCPVWDNGRTIATFYFPSVDGNVGIIQEDSYQQSVPKHECKIDREFEVTDSEGNKKIVNHKNTDSHWNVIGVPSFENATVSATPASASFKSYYAWNASENKYEAEVAIGGATMFNAMHAYMVQFYGTIDWTNVSVVTTNNAPYRYADEKNYLIQLLFSNSEAEDKTFVKLADKASTDFVLNEDMMKIDNAGFPNIYSFAGNYNVAYNETKMENQTVMLGVSAPKNGSYTFAMPKDFSGKAVLVDLESGEATDLNLSNYTVELNKGTYNNRFQLLLEVEAKAPTNMNPTKGEWSEDGKTKKLFINDNIYLINGGRIYNASGTKVR